MLYITSDHGGYELKTKLINLFKKAGVKITDLGPSEFLEDDDYPKYAKKLAEKMSQNTEYSRGIILCRNGVGVSMAMNRFEHIRCALSWSPKHAKSSRKDDNTNVLALPADYVSYSEAKNIIGAWLNTSFSKQERHVRRLSELEDILK
ncbi:RpiB/LacA/LacB family sugar-phosphate isomerase [Candidatus Nomurabacteria bacterium]|uniref:RpiB/LacA/LacB family sugar-phosphate isomerase n=1 Tax=candidate division WWE3 bacterium TaxID=2053526 RepID=A0A955E0E6_UNCKA|nr:RpiB/LacA/LacB family sugar-phosphate isomerase [candidate division WWE3 bacterium]MCB9823567.1 RpiB/LacA/LacB family sugar-phosphate isomerase [Candidatus Nomurabacteria bacterium]MCB9827362.1 RpiB/LacA/LacB family sugar-phosphate isomerase [Candidatus Nomurabacteria bacterium]HXK52763.1 RpiB/LacA/LacB family sugar-phosphate isomerase [bacterium]